MKCLVITGTTPFPSLGQWAQRQCAPLWVTTLQSVEEPKAAQSNVIEWISDLKEYVRSFDLVIAHAGSGVVFELLRNKIEFVCVPNLERRDHHQIELAEFISASNYALVMALADIEKMDVEELYGVRKSKKSNIFTEKTFFKLDEIVDFFYE